MGHKNRPTAITARYAAAIILRNDLGDEDFEKVVGNFRP